MSRTPTLPPGFEPPNYTQTPNRLFDDLLPVLSNAELRVTLVLVRLTMGWHRTQTDRLSLPALAALAGISESSAKTGVQEGLARGTIRRVKTRDELRRPTYRYALRLQPGLDVTPIHRPKKTHDQAVQDDVNSDSSSQKLTGSDPDRMNRPSSQNLTRWPETSWGQNLTGSYKEEKKSLFLKKKRGGEGAPEPGHVPPDHTPPDGGAALAAGGPGTELSEVTRASSSTPQGHAHQQQAPDGAAAPAARPSTPSPVTASPSSPVGGSGQATGGEDVPGGGLGAATSAPLETVQALTPIPRAHLAARPLQEPGSAAHGLLVRFGGHLLTRALAEDTNTGKLPRRDWWPRLTPGEILQVGLTAEREAQVAMRNPRTLFFLGLDRLIGAGGPPADASAPHRDPNLQPGDGVALDGRAALVEHVTPGRYLLRFPDGDTQTVDRTVHAQLARLAPLNAPPPGIDAQPSPELHPGATWQHRATGETRTVQAVQGGVILFDGGEQVNLFTLRKTYTHTP